MDGYNMKKRSQKNHQSYVQGKEIQFTKKNIHTNIIDRTTLTA